ncbi:MAG: MerR family transcriptional regulator [Ktedonobacteraceae bacterium]|nr:MerR family transcriptional regulator [Ktedonobacteraceae bacterium]
MMLKIGEFARIGRVSIATLRHYDQYGLLKPDALDPDTGYRYYAFDQLARLNRILALKELGFPLDQITQLLEEDISLEQLHGMFKLKQAQTQALIEIEQTRLASIAARLRQIEQEGKMPAHEVLLKQVDALLVASIRKITPLDEERGQAYEKILAYLEQQHIRPEQPDILILHSRHEFSDEAIEIDMETAIPLPDEVQGNKQISIRMLPSALMASAVHTGDDLSLGRAHVTLHRWMQDNGYRFAGPPRLVHLQRTKYVDPNQYVTEVQFPVEKQ